MIILEYFYADLRRERAMIEAALSECSGDPENDPAGRQ